jgi:Do/DeqQ family serine protease
VIDNASKINIVLNDKREYEAKLIGKDPNTDLALLKIDAKKLPFVTYGNSDVVKIGEWALAVGNPFNLTSTVTAGIISAKGRNINILNQKYAIESFLQTDAAVNPGNSGGALVNTAGELIGINSAIASNTGSYSGYSFAIPVNIVKKVVADLLEFGEVQRAFIGITLSDLNANLAKEKKIDQIEGVYVAGLGESSAAAEGGVKEGDVILGINDVKVNNIPELQEQVGRYRPGDKVNLKIRRGDSEKSIPVVLKNRNGDTKLFKASETVLLDLGADFLDLSEMEMQKLNIRNGIKVSKLRNGKLKSVGIKEGFIITHIGDKPVNNAEELSNLMRGERKGYLIEGIYPNGTKAYYGLGI